MGPRKKGRRTEANGGWEDSEADESHNGSGQQDGAGDHLSNNGHASNNTNGRRSRPSQGSSPHHEHQSGLGSWTQAVSETVQTMDTLQRAIRDLQHQFTLHKNNLDTMDETRDRLNQLEQECIDKDEDIRNKGITITILKSLDQEANADIERKQAEIERERELLDQDIAKQKKRALLAAEEEKRKLEDELKTRSAQQEKIMKNRTEELEDGFKKQAAENNKRVTSLESERDRLRKTVKDSKGAMELQMKELKKVTEQCEVLEIAKNTFKKEKKTVEKELEMTKKEFSLNSKSVDYL